MDNSSEAMNVEEWIEEPGEPVSGTASSTAEKPARRGKAHAYAKAAVAKAKTLSAAAASGTRSVSGKVAAKVKEIDANHKEVAGKIDTVSMGLGITSGVVSAGAVLAAPSGLSAIGIALGLTSAPLIVTAAPIVSAAAAVTGALSGGAFFYSKWKSSREAREVRAAEEAQLPDGLDAGQ